MTNRSESRLWLNAAGAVTMSFGVLTACMAASWTVVTILSGIEEPGISIGEAGMLLLLSAGFVLLAWGVLRASRLCATIALALSALLAGFQVAGMFTTSEQQAGSIFFLVLPTVVVLTNYMALRCLHREADRTVKPQH